MADKEEVEPTEESSAAGSSDAADPIEPDTDGPGPADLDADSPETDPDADFDRIVEGVVVDDHNPPHDDDDDDTEKALEPAGVGAAAAGSAGAAVAGQRSGRKPKEAATKRRDQPVKTARTGPVKFVKESVGELRKVVYPTGQQLINYFVVVLVFVLFIIAYVSLLDLGLGAAIFKIFS